MAFGRPRALAAQARDRAAQPRSGAARQVADDWLLPLPAPEVQEGGESLWELWHEESSRMELAFAETQPASRTEGPLHHGYWTLDNVLMLARRGNRVCPRPHVWSALHALLEGARYDDLPPPPLQPWVWRTLSNLQRRERFRDYLGWAHRHGKLAELAGFIESVAETDWMHMGED